MSEEHAAEKGTGCSWCPPDCNECEGRPDCECYAYCGESEWANLARDPQDMADACLATWSTPGELQMRHARDDHEHCPPTWCEVSAAYRQADEQCKRPRAAREGRE